MGSAGIGRIGGDHTLLAPGRAPEILQHLAKQDVFGLVVGSIFPSDQGAIHGGDRHPTRP
jgi:hypothetical protein